MAQSLPKIFSERIHVDVFRGHLDRMISVIPGTSFCLTGENPVGCLVTGTVESIVLHEGLQYIHGVAVLLYPVTADTPGYLGEDMTGQVRNRYPGENEKPCVIGKGGEVCLTPLLIPAYKLIAGGRLPGSGSKEKTRQKAIIAVSNQIPHILPHGRAMPKIVIARQKIGEQGMIIGCGLYGCNYQRNKAAQRTAYCFAGMGDRLRRWFSRPVRRGTLTGWQLDIAFPFKLEQQASTRHILELVPVCSYPVPCSTQFP